MIPMAAATIAAIYLAGTWLAGLCLAVLFLGWHLLRPDGAPPVLRLAFLYQWSQVSGGVFYMGVTGRLLPAVDSDYERMVLLGLGCVAALAVGIRLGARWMARLMPHAETPIEEAVSYKTLLIAYVAGIVVTGVVQQLAWSFPAFTQAIIALTFSRLALLFLIVRRLASPTLHGHAIAVLMVVEVLLGFTGYFANFREPLIVIGIALLEVFDSRRAAHWMAAGSVAVVLGLSGLLWMSVRTEYRQDYDADLYAASRATRLERIHALSLAWFTDEGRDLTTNLDALVERHWAVYYPALAVARVPSVLPHTDGEIFFGALRHLVTPRVLFPDKPELPSDSEMVRKYSGVFVAGAEHNTSIAFGYAAESYLDFGVPVMFLPVLLYAVVMGGAYQWFLLTIRHRELAVGLVTVVFWLGLYLFERSWIKTLGIDVTLMVYLGGLTFLVDRFLLLRREAEMAGEPPAIHDPQSAVR
jgi:hypothetical protein